jgi:hypothetical protein
MVNKKSFVSTIIFFDGLLTAHYDLNENFLYWTDTNQNPRELTEPQQNNLYCLENYCQKALPAGGSTFIRTYTHSEHNKQVKVAWEQQNLIQNLWQI